ncbi:MAG TPA: MFS transporter, partial [Pseudomonadota bacterium]|nr:MFS transporter [Pseudomonadota bacterium]
TMWQSLKEPGALWLVLFVATYKIGEELVDPMLRAFLIDAGYRKEQLSLWIGSYGMVASLLGSGLGGYAAARFPLLSAVTMASILRALSMVGQWYLTVLDPPGSQAVILATIGEHFCGGALTTVMFAFMMSRVNKAIGGTHYTLLACVEVVGKLPPSLLSGVLARQLGYSTLFAIGTALSFLFLLLLIPLRRSDHAAVEPPAG